MRVDGNNFYMDDQELRIFQDFKQSIKKMQNKKGNWESFQLALFFALVTTPGAMKKLFSCIESGANNLGLSGVQHVTDIDKN